MKKRDFSKALAPVGCMFAILLGGGINSLYASEIAHGNNTQVEQSNLITVRGTVVDANGETVIGATVVLVEDSSKGMLTNMDGQFTLANVPANGTLRISFVGMKTIEVPVNGQSSITITLQPNTELLDEVVVIGYGTQKKVNLTGAVASIDSKKIASRPSTNVMSTLQGSVPGVTVVSRPGSTSLNIRGRGNLGSSDPLYIVDGIEVSSGFFNSLDPNLIDNVSFLKDASSAAIYGAKAAYGVVLVTTKSGKSGRLQVTYNGSVGSKSPTFLPQVVNSLEYAQLYKVAELNSGVSEANLTFTDDIIQKYRDRSDPDRYPDTNWFDITLKKQSLLTKHNLQLTGGGDLFSYMVGLGYMRNESLTPGDATDRYNVSTKTSSQLKPWLKVTTSVNLIYDDYNRTKGTVSSVNLLNTPPTQVAKHSNGQWGSVRNGKTTTGENINRNQLRNLEESGRANSSTTRLLGMLAVELKPIEDLIITNQIGYDYYDYRSMTFKNRMKGVADFLNPAAGIVPATASGTNQMEKDWRYSRKLIYDGWANYNKVFDEKHDLTAMLGIHADTYKYERIYVGRKDFASNEMDDFGGGSEKPDNQLKTQSGYEEEAVNSYFGRLGYTYDNRYLLEANFRADASSRFAKSGRWGFFPSFSAGWRINNESFMSQYNWIDELKLRASWGKNGNIKNIGLYDTYTTYSASGNIVIGGQIVPVLTEDRIGNPNLTWETTATTNIGLDFSMMRGIFSLTADYYDRVTDGILIRANDIMSETGLSSKQIPARNVGKVRNRGLELSLGHRNTINDFTYSVGANFTYNKNTILDLGDKVNQLPPDSYWIYRKGGSIGDFYMLEANGLYSTKDIEDKNVVPYGKQMPEAGMIKFVDQPDADGKLDGVINDNDRKIVGNDVPSLTYGATLDLSYKGFTLSMLGQGVSNVKVFIGEEGSQAFFDGAVPRAWHTDYWTKENQGAVYPKLFVSTHKNFKYNSAASSFWLFDASYFRIKNITLGYDLPKSALDFLNLVSARVYVAGDNLFTLRGDKRMKDFDPEIASGRGYSIGLKTITAGVSITF